ncbi:MAG: TonB-dependent receptor [Pseudomonadota bacterium]
MLFKSHLFYAAQLGLACLFVSAVPLRAQSAAEDIVIVAQPLSGLNKSGQAGTSILSQARLAKLPYDRLDAALSAQSSFSLFRRIPSLSANPTIQGATLRGIGPNGAGRANVLLDGAPLNDPFGNWVNWSAIPVSSLNEVLIERGGRPLSGGAGALSGQIALETAVRERGQTLSLAGSTLAGFNGALSHASQHGDTQVIASVSGGRRDGYILIPERQRGPADVSTESYNAAANFKIAVPISSGWRAALQLRGFTEGRDNGLAGAVNSTDGFDGSLRLTRTSGSNGGQDSSAESGQWGADILLYGQVRQFENLFTATDAARAETRPVLDQFSVPAHAVGARVQFDRHWRSGSQTLLLGQFDAKSGETREAFRNLGAGFTRERRAGGNQQLYGLGVLHREQLLETVRLNAGVRVDISRLSDGARTEIDTVSGAVLRDDEFAARSDTEPNGELSLVWTPQPAWQLNARGYTGYRMPSLNEFFRPFRVGNDITEANPLLENERLRGVDIGIAYEPLSGQFVRLTLFRNWLKDAVANISIAGTAGGFIAPCGFVPSGGSCRQRGNLEQVSIAGVELETGLQITKALRMEGFYGYTDATVDAAPAAPQVQDNQLPQVPRHRASLSVFWAPIAAPVTASAIVRGQSAQFDDDLNIRRLDGFITLDGSIQWQVMRRLSLRAAVINLLDVEIEAGKTATGLITRGQPLTASLALQLNF